MTTLAQIIDNSSGWMTNEGTANWMVSIHVDLCGTSSLTEQYFSALVWPIKYYNRPQLKTPPRAPSFFYGKQSSKNHHGTNRFAVYSYTDIHMALGLVQGYGLGLGLGLVQGYGLGLLKLALGIWLGFILM